MEHSVTSILLAGVGGQGAILVSRVLTAGLVELGFDVKMSEVHGMAQRGGSVSTQIRYGQLVHSPIIGRGQADLLVAFEKMEAVRYAPYLKRDGTALVNDCRIVPMSVVMGAVEYPTGTVEAMQGAYRTVVIDAAAVAEALGEPRCQNVVLLGALIPMLKLGQVDWEAILRRNLPERVWDKNLEAFSRGAALAS